MLPKNEFTLRLTFQWLALAYFGTLVRMLIDCFVTNLFCSHTSFAMDVIWITIAIPIFIHKWIEAWLILPRPAQWILAFLIGYYSLNIWEILKKFLGILYG